MPEAAIGFAHNNFVVCSCGCSFGCCFGLGLRHFKRLESCGETRDFLEDGETLGRGVGNNQERGVERWVVNWRLNALVGEVSVQRGSLKWGSLAMGQGGWPRSYVAALVLPNNVRMQGINNNSTRHRASVPGTFEVVPSSHD